MGGLVDMAKTESQEMATPLMPEPEKYPYGLRISLDHDDLEELKVDHSDWEIGDVFPLDVIAKVVSKSSNETEGGSPNCSVSLQITHIGAEEHEEDQEEAEEEGGYHKDEEEKPSLKNHG